MATATERPVGEAVLGGEVIGVPVGEVIGVGHGAIIGVTMVETANAIGIETVTMMATAAAVMQTDVVEAAMVTTGAIVTRICANELEHLATLAPASRGYRLGD